MSQIGESPFGYISKFGKCIYCGCQLDICSVCEVWFRSGRSDNTICSSKCRTRKRRKKIREELEQDDE